MATLRSHKVDADYRGAEPEQATTSREPGGSEQPAGEAGQSEQAGRHGDLHEDVVTVGQHLADQDMLVEGKGRGRVHGGAELSGAGTQQRVVHHVLSPLPPYSQPGAESGLARSRSDAVNPGLRPHSGTQWRTRHLPARRICPRDGLHRSKRRKRRARRGPLSRSARK